MKSDYTDPSQIQITTIREVIYLGMHNDVSFMIANEMNLYEQQSSFNPNMPLRQLQYAGNLYEKYIVGHKMNKYGGTLLMLPVPKLVVFYNGSDEKDDDTFLYLSDSFPAGADPDIQVRVRMININYGHSDYVLEVCKPLKEYSWLMEEVRKNRQTTEIEEAVDLAIENMPQDFVTKPFLEAHRVEVKSMLLTEYNEAETMEMFKEEGRAEAIEEAVKNLMRNLGLTEQQARAALTHTV